MFLGQFSLFNLMKNILKSTTNGIMKYCNNGSYNDTLQAGYMNLPACFQHEWKQSFIFGISYLSFFIILHFSSKMYSKTKAIHNTPREFENGGFTLKTLQNQMFRVDATPEELLKDTTITGHLDLRVRENKWLSWRHRFRKDLFSWRITLDGNCVSKILMHSEDAINN